MAKNFTNTFIKNMKYKGYQEAYADSTKFSNPGQLCIRVGKTRISWYIQCRVHGKRKKQNIATYPTVGLADARKLAGQKLVEARQTKPVQSTDVTDPTVVDLWEAYQQSLDLKKKKKAPATLYVEQNRWNNEIKPIIGHLPVRDITPMILSDLLDSRAEKAPVSANRLHSLLSILFKPALKKGWIDTHPLQWIEKPGGSEPPRKRVLSDSEIHTLWPAFGQLKSNPKDMLRLGLLTAQRPGEIARMKWQDIDFQENVWVIKDTKNGTDHMVPLSSQVSDLLLARKYSDPRLPVS